MRQPLVRILLCLALATPLSMVGAQPVRTRSVTTIADGVFMIRHPDPSGWVQGNTTVIVGEREVLVVDSRFTSVAARADIAEIKRRTNLPVRYLVNTHWHQDHTSGNIDYVQAFPGIAIIAHPATAKMLVNTSPTLSSDINRDGIPFKKSIEDRLASGKASNGSSLTDDQRATLNRQLADVTEVLDQARTYKQQMPTMTVPQEITIDLGGRQVEVRHVGRGNTSGDMVIFLPRERVVITGDLLVSPVPFTYDGYPSEWVETLQAIKNWSPTTLVPGHGEVMHDLTYLDRVVGLMETVINQIDEQLRRNTEATLEEVRKGMNLASVRALFIGENAAWGPSFDNAVVDRLVSITYHELKQR